MKITRNGLAEAETDWSCRGCGDAIGAEQEAQVVIRDAQMGAVTVRVPLRFHRGCQRLGVRFGAGSAK